ncbi:MAG: lipocalin family protein [Prevotella sp.]|nr:lipocalin family protein [Prevotella sp.]
MTKRIVIFALMLMAAVGMQAQSLNGTWKTTMTEDGQKMDFYFIFTQSTLNMKGVVSMDDPEVGKIVVSVKVPCTYTRNGNKLNVKTNPGQAKLNIDKMEFTPEIAGAIGQSPELKKMIEDQMKQAMESSKGEIVDGFPSGGELSIVTLTSTKLSLRDETGETIDFTKVR